MEYKNLVQVLGEFGLNKREAEEEIRKTGVNEPDKSDYQPGKLRKVYDTFSPFQ